MPTGQEKTLVSAAVAILLEVKGFVYLYVYVDVVSHCLFYTYPNHPSAHLSLVLLRMSWLACEQLIFLSTKRVRGF